MKAGNVSKYNDGRVLVVRKEESVRRSVDQKKLYAEFSDAYNACMKESR